MGEIELLLLEGEDAIGDGGDGIAGVAEGTRNGAWWALLTSFAWPWIMPAAIDRWMYRSEAG